MKTELILIILFFVAGTLVGYMMQFCSERIVLKKCALKNQEEKLNFFNKLIKKKEIKIILAIINGIFWAFIVAFENVILLAALISVIISLGIVISIIDIRIRIIPNELVLALILAGIAYQLISLGIKSLLLAFCCMIFIMALFLFVGAIMGMDKIGAGDVKLAGAMGLVLGYPNIFSGILFMAAFILIYCFIGFSIYKLSLKSMFAYAPFIMSGIASSLILTMLNVNIIGGSYL